MSDAIFPLVFQNDEARMLTAIVLGFLFGFSLERGGFGNARKLAAQFYLYDMTVFKVMFTAILVAMVGLYTLAGLGFVDLSMMWINPTFVWAQLAGGFLLGVGFIMSGLCPGTSVVSAASGRWDAVATLGGIFVGTGAFAVAVAIVPGLESLYGAGSLDVSVLPDLFGVSPQLFALGVVVVAGVGFVGAEKVEEIFAARYTAVELSPPSRPYLKFQLAGALGLVALAAVAARMPPVTQPTLYMASMAPISLAEAIVERRPNVMILDMRVTDEGSKRIPRAYPATTEEAAVGLLATAAEGATVVIVDDAGSVRDVPATWPRNLAYHYLEDGFLGWELWVLTPAIPGDTMESRTWAARQNQISSYFSGASVQLADVLPPPPMAGAGGAKPKKAGGC